MLETNAFSYFPCLVPVTMSARPSRIGRDQAGDVLGEVLQVGGIEDEDVAAGDVARGAEGVGDAALAAVGDDPEEGILPLAARRSTWPDLVARAVVDDDDFEA